MSFYIGNFNLFSIFQNWSIFIKIHLTLYYTQLYCFNLIQTRYKVIYSNRIKTNRTFYKDRASGLGGVSQFNLYSNQSTKRSHHWPWYNNKYWIERVKKWRTFPIPQAQSFVNRAERMNYHCLVEIKVKM